MVDTNKVKPDMAKMEAALEAAYAEIDAATDILHFEDGQPVTALEGWQIERIFDGLRSVMVQVDEALAHKRKPPPSLKKRRLSPAP